MEALDSMGARAKGYGKLSPYEEHLFWLEVLEDHAIFLHDHLAPQEQEWIRQAADYIRAFREAVRRLELLDPGLTEGSPEMKEVSGAVYPAVAGYFRLEGRMQSLRLWNCVNVNLTPTYFNGTLNENQEYLRLLSFYRRGERPVELPLTALLDLWLEDQLGHAVLLRNVLDPVELRLSAQADAYAEAFQGMMVKNREMKSYERFTPSGFPAQQQFAGEVLTLVKEFYDYVQRVIARYQEAKVLTRTTLRFLEHHLPESCYFMRKLSLYLPGAESAEGCPLVKPSFATETEV
ncbi:DUF2935 domain-containing protein [Paenibacillus filicis]|uniref:DUF2935 domain-containing protein n=1 Tax=Paenibacillus gyeongsangnamensis TaxID=3388067 RepID=A0ABT4QF75_9BACL|nr:DUF2935 domain-containing protein [Paenibacillus filicis]MCZ8515539.1 DUF2935 domain-containing protein [Paenibacillus filicis]